MVKLFSNPKILHGKIMHCRIYPKRNSFIYENPYFAISLKDFSKIKSFLFSFNRINFFSIYSKNYVNFDKINSILKEQNISNIDNIILVSQPKTLFYAFNPVSFFLCFSKEKKLIAVLCEVKNRSNQTHSYLIYNQDLSEIKDDKWFEAKKEFFVSPFLKTEGNYKFRFVVNCQECSFYINYFVENKLILSTYLKCFYQEFNEKNLFLLFVKTPFATFKTTYLIHFQALKLFLKKIKFNKAPKQSNKKLTTND